MANNHTLLRLQSLMKERHLTTYQLAHKADIPYSSLNNLINRQTEPTIPTLRRICDGLGISLSEFFAEEYTPIRMEYSSEECDLIALYQSLKPSDQTLLKIYAQGLARQTPKIE